MTDSNYYATLSLASSASAKDIKAKYRKLSLIHHPDRGGNTEKMAHLNEAYRILFNPLLKREYDKKRATVRPSVPPSSYSDIRQRRSSETPRHEPQSVKTPDKSYMYQSYERTEKQPKNQKRFWSWFAVSAVLVFGFFGYELFSMLQPQAIAATNTPDTTNQTSNTIGQLTAPTNVSSNPSFNTDTTTPSETTPTVNQSTATASPTTSSSNPSSQSAAPITNHSKHHKTLKQQLDAIAQNQNQ